LCKPPNPDSLSIIISNLFKIIKKAKLFYSF
jgi:hypothetical protein